MSGICECGHEKEDHESGVGKCQYCYCTTYKTEPQMIDIQVDRETKIEVPEGTNFIEWETVGFLKNATIGQRLVVINVDGHVAGVVSISDLRDVIIGRKIQTPIIRNTGENPVSL